MCDESSWAYAVIQPLPGQNPALVLYGGKTMRELPENVPYIVHEGILARDERTIKRLIIALIFTIALLFCSNAAWLYAWNQYEYVDEDSQSITVDGKDGVANYIGNDGTIINGEDNSGEDGPAPND